MEKEKGTGKDLSHVTEQYWCKLLTVAQSVVAHYKVIGFVGT